MLDPDDALRASYDSHVVRAVEAWASSGTLNKQNTMAPTMGGSTAVDSAAYISAPAKITRSPAMPSQLPS